MNRYEYYDAFTGPEGDWHNAAQTNEVTEQLKVNSISPFSLSFSTVKVALNITKLAMVKVRICSNKYLLRS